ncbi:transporter [Rhodanobacter soli]|uniref:transporter n=1 Tax=Rhodanobacter soli TaxID=590609 RepID=UPI0031D95252
MKTRPSGRQALLLCSALGIALPLQAAYPQTVGDATPAPRQSLDDAWWTGPMLANSAATLPRGHVLVEPYLYDVRSAHANGYGSLTYMLYGLTDRLTVGLVPVLGYNRVDGGRDSSGVGFGDVSVQAQYRLTQFHEGSWLPTISLQLQETLPTGKYDRLGNRPADGLGSGARTTTLQVNTQTCFWLANGRILRMRFNVAQSFSGTADVADVSVYGTPEGFRGTARPGRSFLVNAAWEYSLSQRWVLAFDLTYRHSHGARVRGDVALPGSTATSRLRRDSGTSTEFGFAPAIEYNWSARVGMLVGIRVITGGHATATTITPAVALNYVH